MLCRELQAAYGAAVWDSRGNSAHKAECFWVSGVAVPPRQHGAAEGTARPGRITVHLPADASRVDRWESAVTHGYLTLQCLNMPIVRHLILKVSRLSCHECAGGCSSLTALSFGFCRSLKALPTSLGCLSNLVSLDLQWCESLQQLPSSIGDLQKLWQLQVGIYMHACTTWQCASPTQITCSPYLLRFIWSAMLCRFQAVQPS